MALRLINFNNHRNLFRNQIYIFTNSLFEKYLQDFLISYERINIFLHQYFITNSFTNLSIL